MSHAKHARSRCNRRPLASLAAGLMLSLLASSTTHANPFALPHPIGMHVAGTCDWVLESTDLPPNYACLTVYTGQVVEFSIFGTPPNDDVVLWTLDGAAFPGTSAVSNGTEILQAYWNVPGTYLVHGNQGPIPGTTDQTLKVIVKQETMIDVRMQLTADNAYMVGVGSALKLSNLSAPVVNGSAAEIFGCPNGTEFYTISAPLHGYLYVVAWSDESVTQGVLGEFRRAEQFSYLTAPPIYSGDHRWNVYATGIDFDGLPGPSQALVEQQLALADLGTGDPLTSSQGWVDESGALCDQFYEFAGVLAVGEPNDGLAPNSQCGNAFPKVCDLNKKPKWMWYLNWNLFSCAFTPGADHDEFLIFRFPVEKLPKLWVLEPSDPVRIEDFIAVWQ